ECAQQMRCRGAEAATEIDHGAHANQPGAQPLRLDDTPLSEIIAIFATQADASSTGAFVVLDEVVKDARTCLRRFGHTEAAPSINRRPSAAMCTRLQV